MCTMTLFSYRCVQWTLGCWLSRWYLWLCSAERDENTLSLPKRDGNPMVKFHAIWKYRNMEIWQYWKLSRFSGLTWQCVLSSPFYSKNWHADLDFACNKCPLAFIVYCRILLIGDFNLMEVKCLVIPRSMYRIYCWCKSLHTSKGLVSIGKAHCVVRRFYVYERLREILRLSLLCKVVFFIVLYSFA